MIVAKVADDIGHVKALERRHLVWNVAENGTDTRVLAKQVYAESAAIFARAG